MWQEFKKLWEVSNPQSANYEFMQEPLLGDEVWVAWDHTARLINAVKDKPDDFVLVPAPRDRRGAASCRFRRPRHPDRARRTAGAEQVIEYLTQPNQQVATLREAGLLPSTSAQIPQELPAGIRIEADAVAKQAAAKDAIPSLLPIGLGAKNGEFNKVYLDTFSGIILKNESIQPGARRAGQDPPGDPRRDQGQLLAADPPSDGPCKVK